MGHTVSLNGRQHKMGGAGLGLGVRVGLSGLDYDWVVGRGGDEHETREHETARSFLLRDLH